MAETIGTFARELTFLYKASDHRGLGLGPRSLVAVCLALVIGVTSNAPSLWAQVDRPDDDPMAAGREADDQARLLRVDVRGSLTAGTLAAHRKSIEEWVERDSKIEYVVLVLDTPGGDAGSGRGALATYISRQPEGHVITIVSRSRPASTALSAGVP